MTQHDPNPHTGAFQRHSDAHREPAAPRPRYPHGEPAAWPAEIPDPNSLPTDWSPSGTAHAGSTYTDYGTPSNAPVSAFTPGAPTGFTSVESTGYHAVVSPRAARSSGGYPGEPGGEPVAWLPAPTEPGGAPASRTRAESHRPEEGRLQGGWAEAPGRSGRSPEFDPASSWNGNTTMGSGRTTTDRDRNPWVVTPVPDRIPAEWDDTAVPDSIPQSWADDTRHRAEPPTATWNIPSGQSRAARRAAETGAATEQWPATRPGPPDEPPARAWHAAPAEPATTGWHPATAEPTGTWNVPPTTRHQAVEPVATTRHQAVEPVAGNWNEPVEPATGSWRMTGRAARDVEVVDGSWQGRPEGGDAAGVLVPRTEAGSSVVEKPEPVTPATRRNPKLTLVAALIAAALAGGGVGAGIVAFTGGGAASSAPAAPAGGVPGGPAPDGQAPGTQPSQAAG
ncbi:MAG TPA: hypothetical protein VN408_39140 [Actinoplanes sp.]|nr:hypothetical protein [Actinoplanes sp.]